MRRVLAPLGAGILLGLAATLSLARLLRSLLFEISPTDAPTLAAVVGLLLASGLAAAYPTIRRAARVDPVDALKG